MECVCTGKEGYIVSLCAAHANFMDEVKRTVSIRRYEHNIERLNVRNKHLENKIDSLELKLYRLGHKS